MLRETAPEPWGRGQNGTCRSRRGVGALEVSAHGRSPLCSASGRQSHFLPWGAAPQNCHRGDTVVVSIAARPCWGTAIRGADACLPMTAPGSALLRRLETSPASPPSAPRALAPAPRRPTAAPASQVGPPGGGGRGAVGGAAGDGPWGPGEAGPCSAPHPSPALTASLLPSNVQLPRPHVRARSPLQLGRGRLHHLRLPGGSGDPVATCWGSQPFSGVPWGGGAQAGWVAPARSRCVTRPPLRRVARWSAPSPPAQRWTAHSTSGTCAPGSAASPAGTPRAPRVSQHGGPWEGGIWGSCTRGRTGMGRAFGGHSHGVWGR